MSKPFSDFRLEVFGNDFKNCNYLSIATSSWRRFPLKKVFFPHSSSVFQLNFSVFLAKILQQIYHRCILYVPRNNWWNTTFWKKKILLNDYGFSAVCFWDLTRSFNRFAKTSHYMQNHLLRKNIFFEQKINYRFFFGLRMESFCRSF